MSLRRIVSLTLMLSIVGMLVTSIVLFIVPQGRVANWAIWTLLGLTKSQWGALHTNFGFLMLVAGGFHVYFNWRPITSYLKNKARQVKVFTPNFNVALGLFVVFGVLTVAEVPPLVWVQDLREDLEAVGAARLGEPPYGHAEESSLRVFLRNTGIDQVQARANLEEAGIQAVDPEVSVMDLALANGLSPQRLFEIIKGPLEQRPTEPLPIPEAMPKGGGRLTLRDFCRQHNRDAERAVAILQAAGWTVDPDLSLKDNAANNDAEGLDLLDLLREGFTP